MPEQLNKCRPSVFTTGKRCIGGWTRRSTFKSVGIQCSMAFDTVLCDSYSDLIRSHTAQLAMQDNKTFTLDDLCTLSDTPKRTVRYYIQIGLVDRPIGETKAAHYLARHLDQLLKIRQFSDAGISLERIREVLSGEAPPLPPRQRQPGSVEVRSHLLIAPGVELQISPEEAGMSPEQVRALVRAVIKAHQDLQGEMK